MFVVIVGVQGVGREQNLFPKENVCFAFGVNARMFCATGFLTFSPSFPFLFHAAFLLREKPDRTIEFATLARLLFRTGPGICSFKLRGIVCGIPE
jgi:hypothetical protein